MLSGHGGLGRRARFRFSWETVQVQVLLPVFNDDKRGFPEVFKEALFVYKKPKIMHEYEFYGICPNLLTNWRSK